MTEQIQMSREADRLITLMNEPYFPETVRLLESGYHLSVSDGARWTLVNRRFTDLDLYFGKHRARVYLKETFAYLEPDPELAGNRMLSGGEMVAGTVAAALLVSGRGVIDDGVGMEDFVETMKAAIGGDDAFLGIYTKKPQRLRGSQEGRMEKAYQTLAKCLKDLARLGFIDVAGTGVDLVIRPRYACYRFAEVVRQAIGDDEIGFDQAVQTLINQGRLHRTIPGKGSEDDTDDTEENEE